MAQLSAEELKELGNETFSKGNYQEAIDFYTQALELHADSAKLNAVIYKNRAMSRLKIEDFEGAELDCTKGIFKA